MELLGVVEVVELVVNLKKTGVKTPKSAPKAVVGQILVYE